MHRSSSPAPTDLVTSDAELDALRSWAFSALGTGRGLAAVRHLERTEADDQRLFGALVDLETELRVRAGIAADDPEVVLPAIAFGDAEHEPDARAVLARAVGAQWLAERSEREHGRPARFRQGRPMLTVARWSVASAVGRDGLSAEQRAEGLAVLDRICSSAWRIQDGAEAVAIAAEAPAELVGVRELLRITRDDGPTDIDRVVAVGQAMRALAQAIEPRWPACGGPWWISDLYGATIDVSDPQDERGRHRFALADCLLELEDMPQLGLDSSLGVRRLAAHVLGVADAALAHAIRSGLAVRD